MTERTTREVVTADLNIALDQLDYGEDIDWPEELPAGLEELWLLRSMTVRFGKALHLVRKRYEAAVAYQIGEGGAARVGDDFMRYTRSPDLVILPALEEWIVENCTVEQALRIAPKLSKIRKTGLAAVCEELGIQTKGEKGNDLLEGSFYELAWPDEPSLSAMPVSNSRTPKYAAGMTSGEIRKGK